jgi:hypothetical protein
MNLRCIIRIVLQLMRIIKLYPPQQINLFGWTKNQPYIQWGDVEKSPAITFRLLRSVGLTSTQLHNLQPDREAWKQHGCITIEDCHEMVIWPMHPCHDLGATLDTLMTKRWTPVQMMQLGLTLGALTDMGMSIDNMVLFGYGLRGWIELGLDREYLDGMADDQVRRVFSISRAQVLHALPLLPHVTPPRVEHALVRPVRSIA